MMRKGAVEHPPDMFIKGECGGLSCFKQFQVCRVLSFAQISLWSISEHCSLMLNNVEQIGRMHRPRFLLSISGCVFSCFVSQSNRYTAYWSQWTPLFLGLFILGLLGKHVNLCCILSSFFSLGSFELKFTTRYNTHTDCPLRKLILQ